MKKLHFALFFAGSIALLPCALAQQTKSNAPRNQSQSISHGNTSGQGNTMKLNSAGSDSATSADQSATQHNAKKTTKVQKPVRRATTKTSKTQQKTRSAGNPSGSPQN